LGIDLNDTRRVRAPVWSPGVNFASFDLGLFSACHCVADIDQTQRRSPCGVFTLQSCNREPINAEVRALFGNMSVTVASGHQTERAKEHAETKILHEITVHVL
jgi:hypothetical protein